MAPPNNIINFGCLILLYSYLASVSIPFIKKPAQEFPGLTKIMAAK